MRAFSAVPALLLVGVLHGQQAMRSPLEPSGRDANGELKLSASIESLASLRNLDDVVLTDLALPGVGRRAVSLTRISLDDLQLGFHVNGEPAPGLMGLLEGLEFSVWKGNVVGRPGSDVLLSFSGAGTRGWIDVDGKRFHLLPQPGEGLDWSTGYSVIVDEVRLAEMGLERDSTCGFDLLERNRLAPDEIPSGEPGMQFLGAGGTTTSLYECAMAVETDFQLNQVFGGDLGAQTSYITMLLAAASDRYVEQNRTRLVYPYVMFYTSAADPWSTPETPDAGTGDLLDEFRIAWGSAPLPGGADLAHFLSGASLGGGIAYLGALCDTANDFSFGVSANLGGNVPFPVQQGPSNWDFFVFCHEVGHNFNSPHTHDFCPPLDQCPPSQYWGSCQTTQACITTGTIMSYCHLCPGGGSNVTTFFHPTAVATMTSHVQSCLPIVFGITTDPPVIVPPDVTTTLSATVTGSHDTVELSYRFSPGAAFTTVTMTDQGGGNYTAALPAPTCLDDPEFFFSVTDAGATLSTQAYTASVGTQMTLFMDNFQSDQGWTVGAGDDDATTGVWTRVDPNATSAQPGEGVNPGSGPFCFVTGQGSVGGALGENDVDGGKTTLFSPVIDLTGQDASVGYYRWYSNTEGAAPNADVFLVEVSNNGTTWVNVETVGPSGPDTVGGWIYSEFLVSDFVAPTATVQVRFVASDEADGSIVEAGVDDFEVFLLDCPIGPQPPVAHFIGSPLNGAAPLTVNFTDQTGGIATSWSWDFGDGNGSSVQHPTHVYASIGTYTIALTATGPDGMDTHVETDYVIVDPPPVNAAFSGTPLTGVEPLVVAFTDLSTGGVTAWSWSFGDGGSSTMQNPTHTYVEAGTYTVSLMATSPFFTDTHIETDYVAVDFAAPVAEFSATPLTGVRPLEVSFTDLSTGTITQWFWSFGDGLIGTTPNVTHTYTEAGEYTVQLTVIGPGGSDPEIKTAYITVTNPSKKGGVQGPPTETATQSAPVSGP